ncbi:MAG TPA: class I SAM-dependent methyltransferase [Chthoniobacterales bacterium]|nr:class I SAM-dependent methyltransferase [Chthoniobacterales bacterium]
MSDDATTAAAFATSWNNLPGGSVYTRAQFEDWFAPLTERDVIGKTVAELGCGNGSLLVHMAAWNPAYLLGVELGSSVSSARKNMEASEFDDYEIVNGDLTTFKGDGYNIVYSIGVLHHLKDPAKGFASVIANTRPGGRFHCWVYAREGNAVIRHIVDPIRKVASRLPWWITKYLIATPLVIPYYFYAKLLRTFRSAAFLKSAPLYHYSLWIAQRDFLFFRHVAFDQLVTPQTTYIDRRTVESWLQHPAIDPESTYIIFRNGNSWKFGGRIR